MSRPVCTLGVALLVFAAAACSSSSKPKPAAPTTSVAPATSPTTAVSPTSTSPAGSTTTTIGRPASSEAVAHAFFAAWVAHANATLDALGEPAAVAKAKAAWSGPMTGFVFSNCSGAAGSLYCTWVRPAESVVIRVDNISVPHRVSDFTRAALDAEGVAQQFFTAWTSGSLAVLPVLGDATSAQQATAAASHRNQPWSFQTCSGAAGSTYCTWTAGSAKVVVRVQNLPPVHVVDFEYTP